MKPTGFFSCPALGLPDILGQIRVYISMKYGTWSGHTAVWSSLELSLRALFSGNLLKKRSFEIFDHIYTKVAVATYVFG